MDIQAHCLCGAVGMEIELLEPETEVAACHCNMCRTWLGGPMLAVDTGVLKKVSGESFVSRYQSSEWAERGFCKQCGTSLFYYLAPVKQYHFPAGLFDRTLQLKLTHQIFIEEKPDYYSFANDTDNMTGAEVFAQFESESSA